MASAVSVPAAPPAMSPVSLSERIDVVDILRGWAIFGMIIVNFSHDLGWGSWFATQWPDTADRIAYSLLHFFAAAKFHALFSFLFGWGFALQIERAEARGARFFPFYARRLFVLLLIGLADWILLDWDATLVEYALMGYVLFLFRGRSLKTVLAVALLCSCYWPAREAVTIHNHARLLADSRTAEVTRKADARAEIAERVRQEEDLRVRMKGSFKEIIKSEAREVASDLSSGYRYLGMFGYPLPLLLLGFYIGRRRVLQDVTAHTGFIRKVFWWGLSLGLVGNAVGVLITHYPETYQAPWDKSWVGDAAFFQVGVPALCFFYAAAIVLLAQKQTWKARLAPLAPVGRMALTNYILQIMIFDVLAYGLGLFGKFGPLLGVFFGALIFLLQALLSNWWMSRFRFGPMEWLWRTLTYGRLQPMRVPARPAAATA